MMVTNDDDDDDDDLLYKYINLLFTKLVVAMKRDMQTYKYSEKATKENKRKKTASKCRLHATMLIYAIIRMYIFFSFNTIIW